MQSRAWILDVGHGSSTVVEDSSHVTVIDGGRGSTLLRFLADRGISRVDIVLVSHADADHFGGISLLLSSPHFNVGRVFMNPDVRQTELWNDFVSVMTAAKQRGTEFSLELNSSMPGHLAAGRSKIEVLAPSQELAIRTAHGRTIEGQQLTPNAMSAVVRVSAGVTPRLLVAGDIDQVGLDHLIRDVRDSRSEVLVFPHHGGRPGTADPSTFADTLTRAVRAQLIVFSIGRARYDTPKPEIVSAVLQANPDAHIACTQLSQHCANDLPVDSLARLSAISQGEAARACCAGTIEVSLSPESGYRPTREAHREFIRRHAPTALCMKASVRASNLA